MASDSDSNEQKLDLVHTEREGKGNQDQRDNTETANTREGLGSQSNPGDQNQVLKVGPSDSDSDFEAELNSLHLHGNQEPNQMVTTSRNMLPAVDTKPYMETNVTGVSDGVVSGSSVIGLQYNKHDNRQDNRRYVTVQPHDPCSEPPGADLDVTVQSQCIPYDVSSCEIDVETGAQSNVHVTGVSGGVVIGAEVTGLQYNKHDNRQDNRQYVNVHWTQNIIKDSGVENERQELRQATMIHIKEWTKGMVHTAASQSVLDLVLQGKTWVTVTGSPGEGKTTAAYLTLNKLDDMGRRVYEIRTPEDYFKVKDSEALVILLNDIFGSNRFNQDNLEKWQSVLTDILDMKEHRDFKDTGFGTNNCTPLVESVPLSVILVSRSNVLSSAKRHLGRFKEHVLEYVVNLTHDMKISTQEKLDIWKYHADLYNVSIDEKTVMEICSMSLSHGFPHSCRLFAGMFSKDKSINMSLFFSKPIEFLNQAMESLLNDSTTGPLLKEMLTHNGFLQLDDITDDERRYQYKTVAERLNGTYLLEENGCVVFQHPSVYDSAALLFAENIPFS